ncbi:PAS domain-containing protein [Dyadobacter bucti]|uniref:PAS domain-containing protein n=1 Tax=Dyadobacter bucti TaxID=2572203 RepID=UPI001107F147|nr:PAS domain-containing protein [Dyadobacter bucti]
MINGRQNLENSEGRKPGSEYDYHHLFDSNPQSMWIHDIETFSFLDVNKAAIRHYGYSKTEFLKLTLNDLRPIRDIPMEVQASETATKNRRLFNSGTYRHRKKNGDIIDVQIQSNMINFKGRKAELVLSTDITGFMATIIQDIIDKRRTDEKFKATFKHTRDAMFIGDETGKCIDFNDAAVAMFGYTRRQLKKINLRQLFNLPPSEGSPRSRKNSLIRKTRNEVVRLQRKDGSLMVGNFNSKPHILPGVYLYVITDITERVEKEEQLRASERRLDALVRESADLIAIVDLDGRYRFVSQSSYPIMGIKSDEFTDKNVIDFIHPQDRYRVKKAFSGLADKKQIKIEPYRFLDSKGKWRWITTTATDLTDDPAVNGVVINSSDITETVIKTNALNLSNERYKLILKGSNEAIYDWDIEKDRIEFGHGFQDIFGYDLRYYNKNLWFDNIHTEDRRRIFEQLKSAVADKDRETMLSEFRFTRACGETALVEHKIIFLRNSNGVAIRAVGSLKDITDYKQNLLKIKLQNKKLKEIAWMQSHIVRAPLARLMGLIDLLKLEEYDTLSRKEILHHIRNSADELDTVIKNIVYKADKVQCNNE